MTGTKIIQTHRQTVVLGIIKALVVTSCFVAVLGTAVLVIVGLRIVLVIPAAIVTKTAVFGSCLPSEFCSPLYFYSFTLFTRENERHGSHLASDSGGTANGEFIRCDMV